MQRKTVLCGILGAALLLMTPFVFADDNLSAETSAVSVQVENHAETAATEGAQATGPEECGATQAQTGELGLPRAAIQQVSLSYGHTCIECSVHADCASICGGGQPLYDYRCQWDVQTCGEHIKECFCN